jgi:hypothetical protein
MHRPGVLPRSATIREFKLITPGPDTEGEQPAASAAEDMGTAP